MIIFGNKKITAKSNVLSSTAKINTVIDFHKPLITCSLQVLPSGEDLGGATYLQHLTFRR